VIEEIKICSRHSEYKVPLIYTFAFPHYEYWCPYCGAVEGMLGAGKNVDVTEVLIGRRAIYEKASKVYLSANGKLCCHHYVDEDKNKIFPKNYSKSMLAELNILSNSWVLKIKAGKFLDDKNKILEWPDFKCVNCIKFMNCPLTELGICSEWEREK